MVENCKNCGVEIRPYQTEVDLQKAKEEFTAELDFMAITDRIDRKRSIEKLSLKLSVERNGFCSVECGAENDRLVESVQVVDKEEKK